MYVRGVCTCLLWFVCGCVLCSDADPLFLDIRTHRQERGVRVETRHLQLLPDPFTYAPCFTLLGSLSTSLSPQVQDCYPKLQGREYLGKRNSLKEHPNPILGAMPCCGGDNGADQTPEERARAKVRAPATLDQLSSPSILHAHHPESFCAFVATSFHSQQITHLMSARLPVWGHG